MNATCAEKPSATTMFSRCTRCLISVKSFTNVHCARNSSPRVSLWTATSATTAKSPAQVVSSSPPSRPSLGSSGRHPLHQWLLQIPAPIPPLQTPPPPTPPLQLQYLGIVSLRSNSCRFVSFEDPRKGQLPADQKFTPVQDTTTSALDLLGTSAMTAVEELVPSATLSPHLDLQSLLDLL